LCAHFKRLRFRRWAPSADPRLHALVADGIRDQRERFAELYGGEPTHIDSHHHVHVCPDVFLSRALERGGRLRQTISPLPAASPGPRTLARRAKHRLLARRFTTTSHFWMAREPSPADGAIPIAMAVGIACKEPVEIMVHPSFDGELEVLRSEAWLDVLAKAPLGPYAALC
jgi:predicted glycoside hydrolase/deacetylase ChbG (UPF0249 family)